MSGKVSGAELHGATLEITFADGTVRASDLTLEPGSDTDSRVVLRAGTPVAPTLARAGGAPTPATVSQAAQTVVVSGPAGAEGVVLVVEGRLEVDGAPGGGTDLDPFEANTATSFSEVPFTIGAGGTVQVPVTLTATPSATATAVGRNHVTAHLVEDGDAGAVSDPLVLELDTAGPDTTPPTLQSRTPVIDATDVAVGTDVTATFSEAIDPATISASSVTLTQGTTPVPATRTLTGAGTTLTIDPDADLAPDTTYTVTLTGAIEDTAGNPLASAPITWDFTTAADDPPPGGSGAYLASDGQVVIEAESADQAIARSGQSWAPGGPAGAVGGAVTLAPDSGQGYSAAEAPTQAPELVFDVDFDQAGTWMVHVRGNPADTAGNSIHMGLDGQVQSSADNISAGGFGTWGWFNWTSGGTECGLLERPEPGCAHRARVGPRGRYVARSDRPADPRGGPERRRTARERPRHRGRRRHHAPGPHRRAPAADATDVAVGANVTATFSEAIDPATITASSVTLVPQGGGTAIAATRGLTAGGTQAVLNPDADLAPDTTYTVTLTGAIEDTAGNPLASAPITWDFTTAPATAAQPGTWFQLPDLPAPPRREQGMAVFGGDIYAFGGAVSGPDRTNAVDVFDPDTWTWTGRAPYPGAAVDHPGVVVLDGLIYMIGGLTDTAQGHPGVTDVRVYDPVADEWDARADLPAPRGGHGTAVLDGKVYVVGGWVSQSQSDSAVVYDPGADAWSAIAPLPEKRDHVNLVAIDGLIYALGGRTVGGTIIDTVHVYDPGADSWSTLGSAFPTPRYSFGSVALDGRIIAFGGTVDAPGGGLAVTGSTVAYDPGAGVWEQLADMPRPRRGTYAAVSAGIVYAVGGAESPGEPSSQKVDAFTFGTPPDPPPGDTTPPTLQSRTPVIDATDVAVDTDVTATFSEAIDPATITASSVTLTEGTTPVPATRTLTGAGTTLTIDPDADLAPDTTYTVTLTGAIEDTAGNPLASAPITWDFTTAADDPPPGGSGAYLASDGQVVIEAESADQAIARSGQSWAPGGPAGAVGGAVTLAPDSGQGYSAAEAPTQAPELVFDVDFDQAGTWMVHVRGNPPTPRATRSTWGSTARSSPRPTTSRPVASAPGAGSTGPRAARARPS